MEHAGDVRRGRGRRPGRGPWLRLRGGHRLLADALDGDGATNPDPLKSALSSPSAFNTSADARALVDELRDTTTRLEQGNDATLQLLIAKVTACQALS